MKIKETLTTAQKITILNGGVSGLFTSLFRDGDSCYAERAKMCCGYYFTNSSNKTISPSYEEIIKMVDDNPSIAHTADEIMGNIIRNKYIEKWDRIYTALIGTSYNPLYGYDKETHKDGDNQDKTTYATTEAIIGVDRESGAHTETISRTGNNSDVTTYDTNQETAGETGSKEVRERSSDGQNDIFGFNSVSPVGSDTNAETLTETIIGLDTDNTTHNEVTKTGTETIDKTISENEGVTANDNSEKTRSDTHAKTGNDTLDKIIDEDTTEHGRDESGAELLTKEIDFRSAQIFYDIVYKDIDSIATLQIYI